MLKASLIFKHKYYDSLVYLARWFGGGATPPSSLFFPPRPSCHFLFPLPINSFPSSFSFRTTQPLPSHPLFCLPSLHFPPPFLSYLSFSSLNASGCLGECCKFPQSVQGGARPQMHCSTRVLRDAFMRLCQKVVVFGHILGRGNRVAVTGEKGNWNEKCQ